MRAKPVLTKNKNRGEIQFSCGLQSNMLSLYTTLSGVGIDLGGMKAM